MAAINAALRDYILARTNNGHDLIDGLIALAKDPEAGRERKDALVYLANRIAGAPITPSSHEINITTTAAPLLPADWRGMTLAEREKWFEKETVRRALAAGGDDDGEE